ncbi:MAG: hypothetical protein ABH872_02030 [Candidatus Omnitrophota bacterium]
MKRKFKTVVIMAFLMAITGYVFALEGPDDIVDKYLMAYKSKDYKTAYGYLTSDSKKDKSEADFIEENTKSSLVTYKIEDSKIEKDKAEVHVTLISLDMKQVFEKAIRSLPQEIWVGVVFGKISDEAMENILKLSIEKELETYLNEGKKEIIDLVRENDGWKIVLMTHK